MSWTYQSPSGEFPVIPALDDPAYTHLQLTLGNDIQVLVIPLWEDFDHGCISIMVPRRTDSLARASPDSCVPARCSWNRSARRICCCTGAASSVSFRSSISQPGRTSPGMDYEWPLAARCVILGTSTGLAPMTARRRGFRRAASLCNFTEPAGARQTSRRSAFQRTLARVDQGRPMASCRTRGRGWLR